MSLRTLLMSAAFALAVPAVALAQFGSGDGPRMVQISGGGPGGGPGGGGFGGGPGGAMFGMLDSDGDGQITREEVEAFRADRFAIFDADGDGAVTEEEWVAGHEVLARDRMTRRFSQLDSDGDGTVSQSELNAGRGPTTMFDRLDANDDDVLTEDEVRRQHGRRCN